MIQGVRDETEGPESARLKVKALLLADGTTSIDSGETLVDLDTLVKKRGLVEQMPS